MDKRNNRVTAAPRTQALSLGEFAISTLARLDALRPRHRVEAHSLAPAGRVPPSAGSTKRPLAKRLTQPLLLLLGGTKAVLSVASCLLLPGRRRRAARSSSEAASIPLSVRERERAAHLQRSAYACEETRALWLCRDPKERKRTADFFATFAAPGWRLEEVRSDGTEVWRLPGSRIHTILGVKDVNTVTKTALEMFSDPRAVFTRVFPRIDSMFLAGEVLAVKGAETLCAATFKLPNLVGGGSAPGFPPREFVWTQYVTRLPSGNVLVTAATSEEGAKRPTARGAVRGTLLTSGYYGRKVDGQQRTRVYYIAQADPAGILPAWLVNFAAGKQAGNVTRLAQMFKTGRLTD